MKRENTNLVRVSLEEAMRYRMSPEQQARFDAIRDEDIDYSDIPDQGNFTDWTRPGPIATEIARRKSNAKKQPAAQANGAGKRKAHAR